ncbi:MAG: hypothetical protein RIS36_1074 [Pseudomonadota bacterium]
MLLIPRGAAEVRNLTGNADYFGSSWNGVGANEHRGNVSPCFGSYIAPFPRERARARKRERTRTSNFISSLPN